MSAMPWFRAYSRMIDDEKLLLLAFEDRWHFVALCCLKGSGLLDQPISDIRTRKIAIKLGVQVSALEEIFRRLREVELIDENASPVKWDELQFTSDTSTDRVKKFREKQRGERMKRQGNVSETPPDTDTDTDTESERRASAPTPPPVSNDDDLEKKLVEALSDEMALTSHGAGPGILRYCKPATEPVDDPVPPLDSLPAKTRELVEQWPMGAYAASCAAYDLTIAPAKQSARRLAKWLIDDHGKMMAAGERGTRFDAPAASAAGSAAGLAAGGGKPAKPLPPVLAQRCETARDHRCRDAVIKAVPASKSALDRCAFLATQRGDELGVTVICPSEFTLRWLTENATEPIARAAGVDRGKVWFEIGKVE